MASQDVRSIQTALAQPFAPEDLEWRLQHVNTEKPFGIAVPFVTNRAIQNRLDEVVGPDRWYNDFRPWHSNGKKDSQLCGITIIFDGDVRITKWDGAEDSEIESIKGGLSDSMKRAAVQWGIGRILYEMDSVLVDVEQRGKTWYIAKKEQAKLDNAYLALLQKKGLTPAKAGGIRTPLAPAAETEAPQQQRSAPKSNKAAPKPHTLPKPEQPEPTMPAPAPANEPETEYEYKVLNARGQNGMSGPNTQLVLEAPDGKRVNAFARGKHPALTPGTLLAGTKLTMKKQDTVMFYILEDYRVVSFQQAA